MSPTILVLDDFDSVRLYHQGFLKRKGYECLGVARGEEALALLEQKAVDLILLDLVMPGMDGREFLGRLDAIPRLARLPVLVITSEPSDSANFSAQGRPAGVLSKPVTPASLLQGVHRLLAAATPAPAPTAS